MAKRNDSLCPWCRRPSEVCKTVRPVGLPVERSRDCIYWQTMIPIASEVTELATRVRLLEEHEAAEGAKEKP
ncbi:hypothetical protein ES708_02731 [subsurface metagenome]